MGLCRDPLVGHHAGSEGVELAGSSPGGCGLEQVTVGVWGVLRQVAQGVFGGQAVGRRAVQRGYLPATAPRCCKTRGRERPGVSHCIHQPSSQSPGACPCVRECNGDCQEEIPKAPERAEGGWLGTHALPGAEAHQDSKMGRTRLGQLSHPPGDKGTPIQRGMGHQWPKHKGHWGHQTLCGEGSCSKHLLSGAQPREQSISAQPAPAGPAHPLHSPHVGADDLKARRERIQGKDLVP